MTFFLPEPSEHSRARVELDAAAERRPQLIGAVKDRELDPALAEQLPQAERDAKPCRPRADDAHAQWRRPLRGGGVATRGERRAGRDGARSRRSERGAEAERDKRECERPPPHHETDDRLHRWSNVEVDDAHDITFFVIVPAGGHICMRATVTYYNNHFPL